METIKIGTQVWSTENLDVDHYRNGDIIPEVQDPEEWLKLTTGAWCYYDNDESNGKKYGKLYNWYAVNDPRGLAPKGWHIPTHEEFETLRSTANNDGNSLKSEGEGGDNGVGTNTTGFSALLSGDRDSDDGFNGLGYYTRYWSSTAYNDSYAYYLNLYYSYSNPLFYSYGKGNGFSVRAIKDTGSNNENN